MKRRDFFKGLVGMAAALVVKPLAKPRPSVGTIRGKMKAIPGMEGWCKVSPGAGVLTTVEAANPAGVRLSNPNVLYEGMEIEIYHGSEYFLRGVQTIKKISGNTVTLDNTVPGMRAGDLIVLPLASDFKGLKRLPYSGKLNTPTVDFPGTPITPEFIEQMNRDMAEAWDNVHITVPRSHLYQV